MSLNKEKIIELLPNVFTVKAEDVENAVIEYVNSEHLLYTHSPKKYETEQMLGSINIYHYFVSCSIVPDCEKGGYRPSIRVIDRVEHYFTYLCKISKGRFDAELSPDKSSIYILLNDPDAFEDIKEGNENMGFDFYCDRKYPGRDDTFSYIQLLPNEDKYFLFT